MFSLQLSGITNKNNSVGLKMKFGLLFGGNLLLFLHNEPQNTVSNVKDEILNFHDYTLTQLPLSLNCIHQFG